MYFKVALHIYPSNVLLLPWQATQFTGYTAYGNLTNQDSKAGMKEM